MVVNVYVKECSIGDDKMSRQDEDRISVKCSSEDMTTGLFHWCISEAWLGDGCCIFALQSWRNTSPATVMTKPPYNNKSNRQDSIHWGGDIIHRWIMSPHLLVHHLKAGGDFGVGKCRLLSRRDLLTLLFTLVYSSLPTSAPATQVKMVFLKKWSDSETQVDRLCLQFSLVLLQFVWHECHLISFSSLEKFLHRTLQMG